MVKYDGSSDSTSCLHWATSFCDNENIVLSVTDGYRVTLTYNLYYGSDLDRPKIDVQNNLFYKTLQIALSNLMFMCEGEVLGFKTRYSYKFNLQSTWTDMLANTSIRAADKLKAISRSNKSVYLKSHQQIP